MSKNIDKLEVLIDNMFSEDAYTNQDSSENFKPLIFQEHVLLNDFACSLVDYVAQLQLSRNPICVNLADAVQGLVDSMQDMGYGIEESPNK